MEESNFKKSKIGPVIITIFIIILIGVIGYLFYLKFFQNGLAHDKLVSQNLVTSGSGLYADTFETGLDDELPFTSKYYFRGETVNNYLLLDNNCFRIVNVAQNDMIKIMYQGSSDEGSCDNISSDYLTVKWDESGQNNWLKSTLKDYLNNWVKEVELDKSPYIVKDATWYIGGLRFNSNTSLTADIKNEREPEYDEVVTYKGIIGLINVSDYMKSSEKLCTSGAANDQGACAVDNYLNSDKMLWTINKTNNSFEHVWVIGNDSIESKLTVNDNINVKPALYLKNDLIFEGTGTAFNPYIINNDEQ